jgi:hypothetical protein
MNKSLVLCDTADGIATLTLNHPEKRNALSRAMLTALRQQLHSVAEDRTARVVILRAEGPAAPAMTCARWSRHRRRSRRPFALCTDVMETIRKLPKPDHCPCPWRCVRGRLPTRRRVRSRARRRKCDVRHSWREDRAVLLTPAVARPSGAAEEGDEMLTDRRTPQLRRKLRRAGQPRRARRPARRGDATAMQIVTASADTVARGSCFYAQLPLDTPRRTRWLARRMTSNAHAGRAGRDEGVRKATAAGGN